MTRIRLRVVAIQAQRIIDITNAHVRNRGTDAVLKAHGIGAAAFARAQVLTPIARESGCAFTRVSLLIRTFAAVQTFRTVRLSVVLLTRLGCQIKYVPGWAVIERLDSTLIALDVA